MAHQKLQRNTSQRRVILEELCSVNSHPTAIELYEMVRRRLPKISLGTVYRNLDLLAAQETIQKHTLGSAEARFDGNPQPHYHVRCVRCARIDDLEGLPDGFLGEPPKRSGGYQILGHRLEFLGICPKCRPSETTSNTNPKECPAC